jgi:acetyl-CoA carboxylase biotin carboxyl carrier protein
MMDVKAEITANVWQVRVEQGQAVERNDELVILESMKMEIPVISPSAGNVAEVKVKPDDLVKEGDVLVVLDDGSE